MLINSIAATAAGLGGGFGDGATKYVAMYRGLDDRAGAVRSLAAVLLVDCTLGLLSAAFMFILAPVLIGRFFPVEASLRHPAIIAMRLSAFVLVLRFAETLFTAAIRGCERYRPAVAISVTGRALSTICAVVIALQGFGLVAILWANLAVGILSFASQGWLAHSVLRAAGVWRQVDIQAGVREVFRFGAFTWLKSTLGVALAHGDRLMIAALLGTGPLAFYTICNQLTQPIHALIASGCNFLFPNLSARTAAGLWEDAATLYRGAVLVSAALVIGMVSIMIVGARPILELWLGPAYVQQYHMLLVTMIVGNGLLAISIAPHYASLALGRSQALAIVTFVAGAASLACGYVLIRQFGVVGGGVAKILTGIIFLSLFMVVRRGLSNTQSRQRSEKGTAAAAVV
jgi:O-antigen/teichoic acid export membrane protein